MNAVEEKIDRTMVFVFPDDTDICKKGKYVLESDYRAIASMLRLAVEQRDFQLQRIFKAARQSKLLPKAIAMADEALLAAAKEVGE